LPDRQIGRLLDNGLEIALWAFAMSDRFRIPEHIRIACMQLALRVLAYYSRLTKRAPTKDDVVGLKVCLANDPLPADAPVDELARAVVERHCHS